MHCSDLVLHESPLLKRRLESEGIYPITVMPTRLLALCIALLASACVGTLAPPSSREAAQETWSGGAFPLDRSAWDSELFAMDSTHSLRRAALDVPVRVGAFPVAPYDSPGNGHGSVTVTVGGLTLSGHFATVNRNSETEPYFDGLGQDATGVVLVTVLVAEGTPGSAYATSRNHPIYLAQGRIGTGHGTIDWLSLAVPDRPDIVVVNTRVFDLGAGRTILVASLADGTLRFLQVSTPAFAVGGIEAMRAFGEVVRPELDSEEVRLFLKGVSPLLPTSIPRAR
jgi:hypothetical protein